MIGSKKDLMDFGRLWLVEVIFWLFLAIKRNLRELTNLRKKFLGEQVAEEDPGNQLPSAASLLSAQLAPLEQRGEWRMRMFVGSVDLGNGTTLELVIVPLKGTSLRGKWGTDTDLLMLCVMQSGRCCTCRPVDQPNRFMEKLGLPQDDAEHLAKWLKAELGG